MWHFCPKLDWMCPNWRVFPTQHKVDKLIANNSQQIVTLAHEGLYWIPSGISFRVLIQYRGVHSFFLLDIRLYKVGELRNGRVFAPFPVIPYKLLCLSRWQQQQLLRTQFKYRSVFRVHHLSLWALIIWAFYVMNRTGMLSRTSLLLVS